jgi:hypothetical protein
MQAVGHDLLVKPLILLHIQLEGAEIGLLGVLIVVGVRLPIGILIETLLILGVTAADNRSLAVSSGDEDGALEVVLTGVLVESLCLLVAPAPVA